MGITGYNGYNGEKSIGKSIGIERKGEKQRGKGRKGEKKGRQGHIFNL